MKGGRIKPHEARWPDERGMTDDPKYCAFHWMVSHPTRSCYILIDQLYTLVYVDILKIQPEQKRVLANMTSCIHIDPTPPMVTEGEPIPQAELQILNLDPDKWKEEG